LKHNFNFLDQAVQRNNVQWGIVTKVLCGNPIYIKEVIGLGVKGAYGFADIQPAHHQKDRPR
jgi:predicted amino acid racemase